PVQPARPRFVLHHLRRPTLYRIAVTMTCRIAKNNLGPCRKHNRELHSGLPSDRIRSRKSPGVLTSQLCLVPHIVGVHRYCETRVEVRCPSWLLGVCRFGSIAGSKSKAPGRACPPCPESHIGRFGMSALCAMSRHSPLTTFQIAPVIRPPIQA